MQPIGWVLVVWMAAVGTAFAQPFVVNTIAGKGKVAYAGDGKAATTVNLFSPNRVAFDAAGNLYVGTSARLCKISGGRLRTIAGTGYGGYTGDGGPALSAKIHTPEGIVLDDAGNIFFSDRDSSAGRRIGTDGIITTVAGTGIAGHPGEGLGTSAQLSTPEGRAVA